MKKQLGCAALIGALALSAAAAFPAPPPTATKPARTRSFADVRDRYVKTFLRRFPVVATYLGAEGLDRSLAKLNGKLRDYSPTALRTERQEWDSFQYELKRVDRSRLTADERVDAELMDAQLAFLVSNLARVHHERGVDVYLEEPLRGVEWLFRGISDGAADWRAVQERLAATQAYLAVALTNLRRGVSGGAIPDRRLIRASAEAATAAAEHLDKELGERIRRSTAVAPESGKAVLVALSAASAAYRDFHRGLLDLYFQKDGSSLKPEFDRDRFAIGETGYAWALKNNLRVSKTPRELHLLGKQKVAETLGRLTAVAKAIAAEKGWQDASPPAVLQKLSDDVPRTDDEMLSWYREACTRLVDYGRRTGMFDPPVDYRLDIVFTPAPLRDTIHAAYYPAPPFTRSGTGQFFVTPTGDDAARLRAHTRPAVASLAAHEGFPGHDWHYKLISTKPISAVRWLLPGGVEDSSSMWSDSMSVEGWAFYTEELVGEPRPDPSGSSAGFYTQEERFFALRSQLLRDVRVVVDTGIHCGFMGFDDAVAYLARNYALVKGPISTDPAVNPSAPERAAVESARKAIYRYSKWPTQALTYHLGKLEIVELRARVREVEGAAFDERRFHEELLSQGTVPSGYFRDSFLASARARAAASAPTR